MCDSLLRDPQRPHLLPLALPFGCRSGSTTPSLPCVGLQSTQSSWQSCTTPTAASRAARAGPCMHPQHLSSACTPWTSSQSWCIKVSTHLKPQKSKYMLLVESNAVLGPLWCTEVGTCFKQQSSAYTMLLVHQLTPCSGLAPCHIQLHKSC